MDGNFLTFLQHNRNLKYTLFLSNLRNKIYIPIVELDVQVAKSKEPIPFCDVKTLSFDSIRVGDSWGGFFDCAWLKVNGKISCNNHENLVAVLDIGGEGCVYNENGAVQGITNVLGMVDRFQSVKGKQIVPINRIGDFKDGNISFYIDCGNNGKMGKSSGEAKFKRATICERREDILALYYDVLACYQLVSAVNDRSKISIICSYINKTISKLKDTSPSSVEKARKEISPMFDGQFKEDFKVYAVGHGHIDLAWLWPVRETKRKSVRTFSNAIYEAEKCPNYVFNGSQPQQYKWIKEQNPELFKEILKAQKAGNIEVQGGMWVEPDTNLPCGESLIRQCYYGKKFFRDEFQKDVKTLWLPDVFGYTAALPQIIKKCGMDNFMTIKLSWNNINSFPHHTFVWNGLDDSEVLVHMPPEGDYNSNATPYAFAKTYKQYKEKDVSNIALMSFGIGDGGGGPGEYHINMAERCEKLRFLPDVELSSSEKFFDELSKNISKYPKYKGELYLEKHQGTYTTQGKVKKNNRKSEVLLHFAEWIATQAYLKGMPYPKEKFDEIWQEVLLYQFHDILPGSSIKRVYDECNERYDILHKELEDIISESFEYLRDENETLTAVNSVDFERKGFLKYKDSWFKYDLKPYSSSSLEPVAKSIKVKCDKNVIENDLLKVTFNEQGQIIELLDKQNNYNCVSSAFNLVRVYKDRYVHPYNAWDIDIKYTKKKPTDMKLVDSKQFCDGNSVVRINKFEYNKSTVIQKIVLLENCPYVTVENDVDWQETHKMLRIDAYTKNFGEKVLCDIQFGNIERSTKTKSKVDYAQFEIPAHKWVDVYDDGYGVAILNDCKYGHRVKDGLISLNCLRSPVYPDKTADRGKHSFSYAIYPHKEKALDSDLIKIGYEFNNPLKVYDKGLNVSSILTSDQKNIIVETIMVNENGNIGVRLYETAGVKTVTNIDIGIPYNKIFETNMLFEKPNQIGLNSIEFKPFEVKTLEIIK